ncbi:trihelix transcription factor GTL2-like [Vigna umbellata]|uniref:trihelix transcription factor GTL2-like n=1 Tax=Vigna umbellata TaxID=87088 RepID=UPI001F5FC1AB|nr:trihelix transcription factor GTL2-like [Vigna umbellata]
MFDGVSDQFHQFIAPRTTLPLHLSFPLHASSTSPTTFLPFDPYNPSQSQQHHFPLQTNLFHPLHPPSPPTHKHKLPSIHIHTHQTQLPDLTDSWSNDELLALFRIRSTMENCFPEHTWDHVSRKLAELGFKKSAEKCKEKFEDESGYFDNVSNYGKNNYRFLSELEELCQNPDSGGGGGGDCDGGDDGIVRSEKTLLHLGADNMGHRQCDGTDDKVVVEKSKERKRKRRDRFEMFKGFCESFVNKMMAQQEEIHNRLLEDMVKRDQEKFAREEAWKKQEMEKMNKELDIMAQEQAIAGDRHATIIEFLKKCATKTITTSTTSPSPPSQNANGSNLPNRSLLHSLNPNSPSNEDNNLDPTPTLLNHDETKLRAENPSSSETLLQVPSSSNSSPTPHNPSSSLNSQNNTIPLESNSVSTYKTTSTTPPGSTENSKDDVGRRWPRDEVLALINLRCTSVSNNNNSSSEEKEGNNKGPLWERISQGMSEVGYKRSAKRCKEKWENINKYFRKTKDVNKKRSLNSRTCPYFHQLSCLYGQGKIVAAQSEREGNYMSPTANSGQVPPDVDDEDESSHVGSGGLDHYAC